MIVKEEGGLIDMNSLYKNRKSLFLIAINLIYSFYVYLQATDMFFASELLSNTKSKYCYLINESVCLLFIGVLINLICFLLCFLLKSKKIDLSGEVK